MARSITVTELTCACLDEQWRRRWLKGENPSTRSFSPPGELPAYGSLFHRLVDRFGQWLLGSKKKASSLHEPAELWHELYERFAAAELERTSRKGHIDSAYHLSEALKAICARISTLRSRTPSFAIWQNLYLANEFLLKEVEFKHLSDQAKGEITVDIILCPPEEFEVVAEGKGVGPQVSPGVGGNGIKTHIPRGKPLHDLPDWSGHAGVIGGVRDEGFGDRACLPHPRTGQQTDPEGMELGFANPGNDCRVILVDGPGLIGGFNPEDKDADCPIKVSPAIYVTSAAETRSRANQFLLKENQPRPSEP